MSFIGPIIGGVLIGFAAVIMMVALGRVCGISGIFRTALHNLLFERGADFEQQQWRWLFLLGLVLGPVIIYQLMGLERPAPLAANELLVILAGLLVGVGTRLGSGCTSGHGVCGIARFSVRSMVATVTFMVMAIVTVYVMRHVIGGKV